MNSFSEIPLSETTLDVWEENLRHAGLTFETRDTLRKYVEGNPDPYDITQRIETTERNNYIQSHMPSDFVKETIENDGGDWTDLSPIFSGEYRDEEDFE